MAERLREHAQAAALFSGLLAFAACSRPPEPANDEPAAARDVVLFLGDSLTAGYGISLEDAFPALLDARWREQGRALGARNAGVSGSTSAGVLETLDWTLAPDVRGVFICVGANDGLRGLDLKATRRAIGAILKKAKAKGAEVVLAGMKIPANYGAPYSREFEAMYPALAREHGVKLMPFLLEGVAGRPELNLPDGIHPNEAGHRALAENVETFFEREGLFR